MDNGTKLPRRALAAATLTATSLFAAGRARAETWPDRPVRLMVGFPPGGSTDIVARLVGLGLSAAWGQPVVIENRGGANATIATDAVARAAPDGYTLLFAANNLVMNPPLFARLPYDIERDLAPIHCVGLSPNVLTCGSMQPWRSLAELVAAAKAQPGRIGYSSSGMGSNGHYALVLLGRAAGIDLAHYPYRGAAPATQDTIAGTVPLTMNPIASLIGAIRADQLRPLAVTGARRAAELPDTPTFAEAGFDLPDTGTWYGVLAPSATPPALVGRLSDDIGRLLRQPEFVTRLTTQGAAPFGLDAAAFKARIHADLAQWRQVAEAAGIRPE
ncbi:MAG TPA: tripartite tricarboxylate transporter substrate binding protein [Roseomonas sp.]|jgi:tripartite-type tricarboxylate transporter receptor subunit TctC